MPTYYISVHTIPGPHTGNLGCAHYIIYTSSPFVYQCCQYKTWTVVILDRHGAAVSLWRGQIKTTRKVVHVFIDLGNCLQKPDRHVKKPDSCIEVMRLPKMQILYSMKTYSQTADTERISIYHLWYNQSWRSLYLERDVRNGLWSKATQYEVWMEMESRKNRETNNPTGEPCFQSKQSKNS